MFLLLSREVVPPTKRRKEEEDFWIETAKQISFTSPELTTLVKERSHVEAVEAAEAAEANTRDVSTEPVAARARSTKATVLRWES